MTSSNTKTASDSNLLIKLPMIHLGQVLDDVEHANIKELNYENGITVQIPEITQDHLDEINQIKPSLIRQLYELSTDEITQYLNAAADRWLAGISEGRIFAEQYAHKITGYPSMMLTTDYETIGHFLVQRFHTWDTIEAEFGSERIFDEWIPRQMVYLRAFPRGLLLQYLVGNLPLAGMYTIIRGIITRNINLLKMPTRDPITVLGFVRSLLEVDNQHPIAKSLSVAYWPHESKIGDACIESADSICIWGGERAVEAIKRKAKANIPVSEYGPRWSAAVIDLDECDAEDAALRLVEDSSFYDQEACFNIQRAYVKGNTDDFIDHLIEKMKAFSLRFPMVNSRDSLANKSLTLLEAMYSGYRVERGDDWAIVVLENDDEPNFNHPLTRTLFVKKIQQFEDVYPELNRFIQTISVFPWKLSFEIGSSLAINGANRIVEMGWTRMPRQGFTHDGMQGLHSLVRLVTLERTREDFGKYYVQPSDMKTWQKSYISGEKWWSEPWWSLVDRNVAETGR